MESFIRKKRVNEFSDEPRVVGANYPTYSSEKSLAPSFT